MINLILKGAEHSEELRQCETACEQSSVHNETGYAVYFERVTDSVWPVCNLSVLLSLAVWILFFFYLFLCCLNKLRVLKRRKKEVVW